MALMGIEMCFFCHTHHARSYQGATTAKYPCLPVAGSTTAYGRDAIMTVVDKIENVFELPADMCPNGERPIIIGGG